MNARWTLVSISIATATIVAACGGAVRGEHDEPSSDDANVAGTATKTPQPGSATGTSSSGSSSTTSTGGARGSDVSISGCGAATGGAGGDARAGAPAEDPIVDPFGLITGDEACPAVAPTSSGCSESGASCVYRNVAAGSSWIPMAHCVCTSSSWACVNNDENGNSKCPLERPTPDDVCPADGAQNCQYALFEQNAVAACFCSGSGASWNCGL